jgi:F-type H+-transporting ATPase subunit b
MGVTHLFLAFAGNAIQLVPDGTIILHLFLIILMVAILNATLLKPINRVLQERERLTAGRLTEAQSVVSSVEQKMREYERQLREARSEGYSLLENERAALTKSREQKLASLRAEIADLLRNEKQQLANEAERAHATLEADSQKLARDISQHILRRPLTGEVKS